jgi:cell division protein FtsI/penicillin-binding protein 2
MLLDSRKRITFLSIFIIIPTFVIVGRLYVIQVLRSGEFRRIADSQYVVKKSSIFDRGSIFFESKDGSEISAATLKTGYTVAVNPKLVKEPEDIVNALSGYISADDQSMLLKSTRKNSSYEVLARRVDEKAEKAIDALSIDGLAAYKERWREYPGNRLASHVLGFVGYKDENTIGGVYGLERFYEDVLSRNSLSTYANFFAQVFLGSDELSNGSEEGDIVTTIEPVVQSELQSALMLVQKKYSSDRTGGIVMNPKTGEIYAMAMTPDFDPNSYGSENNQSVFINPIVQSVFEMGSIVKPLAMAAGIDAGVVTPSTHYDDKGFVVVDGATISNFDHKGRGNIDMQRVLSESLNTGMAFVTGKLGNDRLARYFRSLGLGEKTGIDLPGEVLGLVKNLESPRDVEYVTASFGQGIAMTPIEITRALSALGNGGIIPTPHIVKRIEYVNGTVKKIEPKSERRVWSEKTSEDITNMLVNVADKALLGGTVKMEHYSMATKTGTAQMARESGGGYYDDRYLHSFFGYFPAYNPRFIVFLFTVYPKGVSYASHTLTEPYINLAKFLISYYNVPPDR